MPSLRGHVVGQINELRETLPAQRRSEVWAATMLPTGAKSMFKEWMVLDVGKLTKGRDRATSKMTSLSASTLGSSGRVTAGCHTFSAPS